MERGGEVSKEADEGGRIAFSFPFNEGEVRLGEDGVKGAGTVGGGGASIVRVEVEGVGEEERSIAVAGSARGRIVASLPPVS